MNLPDLTPAKAVGRGLLAVLIIGLFVAGLVAAVRWVNDPLGLGKKHLVQAESAAATNGQQAASNAAGATINDQRAANLAKLDQTAQEARHAVQDASTYDDAAGDYLAGLERLRHAGAAPIGEPATDDRRSDVDSGS